MSRRAPELEAAQVPAFQLLAASLASLRRPVTLQFNGNRRILISLRGGGHQPLVISIHPALLDYPQAMADLPSWVERGGGRCTPTIQHALEQAGMVLSSRALRQQVQVQLEPLGGPLQLEDAFSAIHRAYFSHLPIPEVTWSRQVSKVQQRHLRFASYRRLPSALVLVHPRLNQPWVAREFVNYVLYHELCHHAQACDPQRHERPHSTRFRLWERRYPDYPNIILWERQHLEKFLRLRVPLDDDIHRQQGSVRATAQSG